MRTSLEEKIRTNIVQDQVAYLRNVIIIVRIIAK